MSFHSQVGDALDNGSAGIVNTIQHCLLLEVRPLVGPKEKSRGNTYLELYHVGFPGCDLACDERLKRRSSDAPP